jgi:hypothetical protein
MNTWIRMAVLALVAFTTMWPASSECFAGKKDRSSKGMQASEVAMVSHTDSSLLLAEQGRRRDGERGHRRG